MATMSIPTQAPEPQEADGPVIPSLLFDNRTDYDALHFDTLDQHDQAFHVIVAKIGYRLGACNALGEAPLIALEEAAEISAEDQYYEDNVAYSVRQESDLAPYKPHCDVIVNATAHAPQGKPARHFAVRLRVHNSATPATLPEAPRGLNPLQDPSVKEVAQWQHAVNYAQAHPIPGALLLDKTLSISGARHFRKKAWPFRLFWWGVKWASLWIIRRNPWKLTAPQKLTELPLRYEHAFGGECRINLEDKAAKRIPKKQQLSPEQQAQHPEQPAPIAHTVSEYNPLGLGYAEAWYLKATQLKRIPAPQIESRDSPISAKLFWQVQNGKLKHAQRPTAFAPAGMGIVGRAWLPRRALVGHFPVKSHWADDEVPRLPEDFDFRYWNSAPSDQQCVHLHGAERFTLTNLCAPDAAFAGADARGNTEVRFTLPRQSLFILAASIEGAASIHTLDIDSVVIDLEAGRVDLVWRICLAADGELHEARLLHARDAAQLQRLQDLQTPPAPKSQAADSRPTQS